MIRHAMDVVKAAVDVVNPGQVPIIACDQPLYAIAKQIQWSWSSTHGEDHYVVMFRGLHFEMGALRLLGNLLEDSGWTGALTQARIASSGTADSFIKASHVTRTRRAHQITISSLYLLLKKAYNQYVETLENETQDVTLEEWCSEKAK